jgi:hypothetical protein
MKSHFGFSILDVGFWIEIGFGVMNSIEDRQSKIAAGVLLHNDEKWEG